jgi:hypothetical protein
VRTASKKSPRDVDAPIIGFVLPAAHWFDWL